MPFETQYTLQRHLRHAEPCEPSSENKDYISRRQEMELRKKSDRRKNREEQWFDLWRVLFPGLPLPFPYAEEAALPSNVEGGCKNCNVRRVKCDQGKPTCNRCAKANIECDGTELSLGLETSRNSNMAEHRQIISALAPKAPITDSGYFSNSRMNIPQHVNSNQHNSPMHVLDNNDDSRTTYSAADSITIVHQQHYISEACQSIQNELGYFSNRENWAALSDTLLEVLKAFSIRIGLESSTPESLKVMWFFQKFGRKIADELLDDDFESEILDENEENDEVKMSMEEKMSLWNASVDSGGLDGIELFVGVGDDDDDDDDEAGIADVELPTYKNVITKSKSFRWLVLRLKNEMKLQDDPDRLEGCGSRINVRQKILQNLPTGAISRSVSPQTHTVKIRLLNWSLFQEQEAGFKTANARSFDSVVVACCGGNFQALSIERYMAQIWPLTWYQISSLVRVVENSTEVFTTNLPDGTCVSASAETGHLIVTISGSSHTIAECAEQLAWLHAALQCSCFGSESVIQQAPFVADPVDVINYSQDRLWESMPPTPRRQQYLCFDISVRTVNNTPSISQHLLESVFPEGLLIVPGYPILRRPPGCSGFEVPPEILLQSRQKPTIDSWTEERSKIASSTTLSLVQQEDGFYIWHESQSSQHDCCCNSQSEQHSNDKDGTHDIKQLLSGRHFVEQCSNQGKSLDVASWRSPALFSDSSSLAVASFTYKAIGSGEGSGEIECSAELAKENEILTADILPQHGHQQGFACFSPAELSESSIDSDWLPSSDLSDSSEHLEFWHKNSTARMVLEAATCRIVISRLPLRFRSVTGGQYSAAEDPAYPGAISYLSLERSRTPLSGRHVTKRKRDQDDEPDSGEDRRKKRSAKSSQAESPLSRSFACPFWVIEPKKHVRCMRYTLSRIGDVKQHLNRKHVLHFYCRHCLAIFPGKEEFDAHTPQGDMFECELAPPSKSLRFEGILPEVSKELSKKSKEPRKEDQWFAIWETLFSGKSKPRSPYLDYSLSEDVALLKREVCLNGGGMIFQELQKANVLEKLSPQEKQNLRKVLDQGTDLMFDGCCIRLFANAETGGRQESRITSRQGRSSKSRHPQTPAISITDSGVGMKTMPKVFDTHLTNLALPASTERLPGQTQQNILQPSSLDHPIMLERIQEKDTDKLGDSNSTLESSSSGHLQSQTTSSHGVDDEAEVGPFYETVVSAEGPNTSGNAVTGDWNEPLCGDQSFWNHQLPGGSTESCQRDEETRTQLEYPGFFALLESQLVPEPDEEMIYMMLRDMDS